MHRVCVASGSGLAAEAGATVAGVGGNAVDAAIAAVITSMCTEPGIVTPAAGGFITVDTADSPAVVIDAYAEMPGRSAPPDRVGNGTRVRMGYGGGMETVVGYGSVATPGMWAGLEEAWRRSGSLPWAVLFEPAITAVERGFPLSVPAAEYLVFSHDLVFGWDPASRAVLHDSEGAPLAAGAPVHIDGLADSLRLLARQGADALYRGELGQAIVSAVDDHDGLLGLDDLDAYRAVVRRPLRFRLGDATIATNPPPAIGGATMASVAMLAAGNGFGGWDDAGVEILLRAQRAVLDYRRRRLGDSDAVPAAIENLLEAARLGEVRRLIEAPSTSHTSAADAGGTVCAITVSAGYGSGAMPPGTGIWLNNSLGETELHPTGYHGLDPGTRLVSNMAPTTVRRGEAVFAIGSPGADRITTAVSAVLLNLLIAGMPLDEAIEHPRMHTELFEGRPTVAVEPGIPLGTVSDMVLRRFPGLSMYFGGVGAAGHDPAGGLTVWADSRRGGATASAEPPT